MYNASNCAKFVYRPGTKPDLKKLAKSIGAKELRIAGDTDKAVLGLPAGSFGGSLTAMSVVGDTENKVSSLVLVSRSVLMSFGRLAYAQCLSADWHTRCHLTLSVRYFWM